VSYIGFTAVNSSNRKQRTEFSIELNVYFLHDKIKKKQQEITRNNNVTVNINDMFEMFTLLYNLQHSHTFPNKHTLIFLLTNSLSPHDA
jgi:hypothetical protein